tara:strand:- start:304 stop:927 length:624 start_codon:yes stop_codon:yes gene_type:complete
MWHDLPTDLQDLIATLVFVPDKSGFLDPRILGHYPNRKFLAFASELRRRVTLFKRARQLTSNAELLNESSYSTRVLLDMMRGLVSVAIDHVRLFGHKANSPFPFGLLFHIRNYTRLAFRQELIKYRTVRRAWVMLGRRFNHMFIDDYFGGPSAVDIILAANLTQFQQRSVANLLAQMFQYLRALVPLREETPPKIWCCILGRLREAQ